LAFKRGGIRELTDHLFGNPVGRCFWGRENWAADQNGGIKPFPFVGSWRFETPTRVIRLPLPGAGKRAGRRQPGPAGPGPGPARGLPHFSICAGPQTWGRRKKFANRGPPREVWLPSKSLIYTPVGCVAGRAVGFVPGAKGPAVCCWWWNPGGRKPTPLPGPATIEGSGRQTESWRDGTAGFRPPGAGNYRVRE